MKNKFLSAALSLISLGMFGSAEQSFAQEHTDSLQSAGGSLVFVEAKGGAGSGFACKIGDKNYVVTNQHVIAGQSNVKFTLLDRSLLKTGAAMAATGHDIVAFAAAPEIKALEIQGDLEKSILIGDEVVVLGNTEGARVIQPLKGKLVGIGPDLVEVSAEFLPGNSGSPIIHLKSGKVIGVATYLTMRDLSIPREKAEPKVRRFGYRIDSIKKWQPINWPVYQQEHAQLLNVEARTGDLAGLLEDLAENGRIDPQKHQNAAIKPPIEKFTQIVLRKGISKPDRNRAIKDLMSSLRTACTSDIDALRPRLRYDYFQRRLNEESQARTQFWEIFDKIMKAQ